MLYEVITLMLNRFDIEAKNYPYMKFKSWMFVLLFILLNVELSLDFLYFTHIETTQPVSCCSVIYGQLNAANTLPLGLDIQKLLILFYLLFLLLILSMTFGRALLRIVSALGFSVVSYYSVVYFFGIYIYELPTHRCPFCIRITSYNVCYTKLLRVAFTKWDTRWYGARYVFEYQWREKRQIWIVCRGNFKLE